MKKMMILLAISVLVFSSSAFAVVDSEQVGFTLEGVFYISDDLVEQAGYGTPTLKAALTGWVDKAMTQKKGKNGKQYWVVSVGKKASGVIAYCFHLGYSQMYAPHVLVDLGVITPEDKFNPSKVGTQVVPQYVGGSIGYNFIGKAVAEAPF